MSRIETSAIQGAIIAPLVVLALLLLTAIEPATTLGTLLITAAISGAAIGGIVSRFIP